MNNNYVKESEDDMNEYLLDIEENEEQFDVNVIEEIKKTKGIDNLILISNKYKEQKNTLQKGLNENDDVQEILLFPNNLLNDKTSKFVNENINHRNENELMFGFQDLGRIGGQEFQKNNNIITVSNFLNKKIDIWNDVIYNLNEYILTYIIRNTNINNLKNEQYINFLLNHEEFDKLLKNLKTPSIKSIPIKIAIVRYFRLLQKINENG